MTVFNPQMKPLVVISFLLLTVLTNGCVSKSTARAQARTAYLAGQREALAKAAAEQRLSVLFDGPVQNHEVEWTDGLTLAQAIVNAGYNARGIPKQIVLTRGGESAQVDPKSLLRGAEISLEPGDTVTLR